MIFELIFGNILILLGISLIFYASLLSLTVGGIFLVLGIILSYVTIKQLHNVEVFA